MPDSQSADVQDLPPLRSSISSPPLSPIPNDLSSQSRKPFSSIRKSRIVSPAMPSSSRLESRSSRYGIGASMASSAAAHSIMQSKLVRIMERVAGEETCKYAEATDEYLEKRGLEPNSVSEWGMYCYFLGLMISLGLSLAWNGALIWGYGPVVVSTIIAGLAYFALVTILSEMMSMLPFSGGMATFARSAFGPHVGFLVGTCEMWEYVFVGSQAVWQSGIVLATAFDANLVFAPFFWILTVGIVAASHVAGTKWVMRLIALGLVINLSAMIILIIPSLKNLNVWQNALLGSVNLANPITGALMDNTDAKTGMNSTSLGTYMFPFGSVGVFQTIPLQMWTFLGVEAAPLCCEEAVKFTVNGPRIALKAQATMFALAMITMIVVPMLAPGTLDPLIEVFVATYNIQPDSVAYNALYCCLFLPNLLFAMACFSFACSRQIYALSLIGYYPKRLSVVWEVTRVPIGAVAVTLVFFMTVALILQYEASGVVLTALLNGSLLYGMFAYIGMAAAYIKLRIVSPHVKRPFDAGYFLGITCSLYLIACCLTSMIQMFATVAFRETLYFCLVKIGIQYLQFLVYQRFHMVETPEEQFIHVELNLNGLKEAESRNELADAGQFKEVYASRKSGLAIGQKEDSLKSLPLLE
ncbi:hypothetical protein HDU98_007807 [Podochytrium sp. JEL0797]|nr:hypothetical protein HDU98_007807 [Podochytrium sp. JEL0797]